MYTKIVVDLTPHYDAKGHLIPPQPVEEPLTNAELADLQARQIAATPPTLTASPSPVAINAVSTITATLPAGSTDTAVTFQQTAPTQGQQYTPSVNALTASLGYQWRTAGTYTVRVTRRSGAYAEVQVVVQ